MQIGISELICIPFDERCSKRVVAIRSEDENFEIMQRIDRIEQAITQGFRNLNEKLSLGEDTFMLLNDGLRAYRQRCIRDSSNVNVPLNKLFEKIRNDKDLRFPHRKILEFLLSQYDFNKQQFNEVYFSRLVRESHVGKNMANCYLSLLEQKGYIQKRDDGYRVFIKINDDKR